MAKVEDRDVAGDAALLGPTWTLTDEIYQFRNWDRSKRHVLLSLDTARWT